MPSGKPWRTRSPPSSSDRIQMPTVLESLNFALHRALASDPRVYVLGEDLLDPYGGAFKVTRGLSTAFPGRVLTTPISEAAIVGMAAGMALRGLRPVAEIMFGDFITLAADQLINHAAKFGWMYSGGKQPQERVAVPMVVRTPMGGRRGYGPTHSQTLEKLFLGVPGLQVLAPAAAGDPGKLLETAIIEGDAPTLFIENKLLYLLPVQEADSGGEIQIEQVVDGQAPAYAFTVRGAPPPSLTLAAYGYMADLARQAITRLAYECEIFAELVIPTRLAPMDAAAFSPVLDSARHTGRLLVIEEGTYTAGWGAEILARSLEHLGPRLKSARRVAAREVPVPASVALEQTALPGVDTILQIAIQMV